MECTATVAAGESVAQHLSEGAVICLKAGTHTVNLSLGVSITLIGEDGAVLDGGRRGPVVHVGADKAKVTLKNLQITNGTHDFGSGLLVDAYADVFVEDCVFEGNHGGEGHGAGIGARRGWVTVTNSRFGAADDLVFTTTNEAFLTNATVEGEMRVLDGAKVEVTGGSVAGKVTVRGTTTRRPSLTLKSGASVPNIEVDAVVPGDVIRP